MSNYGYFSGGSVKEGSLVNPGLPIITAYDDSFDKSTVEEVLRAAGQGNPAAIYELGSRYRLGVDGVEENKIKAIELYKEVLKYQNHRDAFYHIGFMLSDGAYGEEQASKCVQYYEAACELQSSRAASQLAILHEYGQYVPRDLNRAIYYYDKAIEFGNGNGSERTSKAWLYEKMGKIDLARKCWEETLEYYDNEIRNGKPEDAAWCWGEKGDIYKRLGDYLMAKDSYEKAIACGQNPQAATMLGTLYEDGIPGKLEVDLSKAYYYYKLGYDTRYNDDRAVLSINMLALFLFHDKAGKGQDFRAFQLFNEIRELGSNRANIYLGYYYGMGIPGHVDVNVDYAFNLLDDVPEENIPTALYYKGVICLKTLRDEQRARTYLEAAAQRGDENAKSILNSLNSSNNNPDEIVYKSQRLLDSGDLGGAFQTIVQGYNQFPNNLSIMRQVVKINDIVLIGRAVTGKLNVRDKETCYMVLDLIKQLRANSYEVDGLQFTESNVYYCLGCIYHMENDVETALRMLSSSNVDYTPDMACEFFSIHIEDIDRFINELYIDASRLRQSLNSQNWHTKTSQALAYLALSMIYSNGAPGVASDINYAYNYIQQCNALDPNVAADQIRKYNRDYSGRIVYTP